LGRTFSSASCSCGLHRTFPHHFPKGFRRGVWGGPFPQHHAPADYTEPSPTISRKGLGEGFGEDHCLCIMLPWISQNLPPPFPEKFWRGLRGGPFPQHHAPVEYPEPSPTISRKGFGEGFGEDLFLKKVLPNVADCITLLPQRQDPPSRIR